MTESELYQKELKPFFKTLGAFYCRVEAPCFPDIYVCRMSHAIWIEMKCVNKRSKIIEPEWRMGQLSWIRSHQRLGGDNVFLALHYCGTTYFLKPQETYTEEELVCLKNQFTARLMGTFPW